MTQGGDENIDHIFEYRDSVTIESQTPSKQNAIRKIKVYRPAAEMSNEKVIPEETRNDINKEPISSLTKTRRNNSGFRKLG